MIINAPLADFGLGIIFFYLSLFLIFSHPLTYEGEMKILFGLLEANLNDFENRQSFLKIVSRKVENQLKLGNIRVPHNDLIYYFNMSLMRGLNVTDDLKNIESWITDKKTSCFESLKKTIQRRNLNHVLRELSPNVSLKVLLRF